MSDWQSSKTLAESHLYLFQNEVETDVEFLVGDPEVNTKTVRAHRIILASRSPVFYAMLYGEMREQKEVIPLPDIEIASMRVFLTYLYTDKADLRQSNVVDVLNAAIKYCVDNLSDLCKDFLATNINQRNLVSVLETSAKYGINQLTNSCAQFIVRNQHLGILQSNRLNKLSLSSLKKLVSSDYLAVNELVIFQFVVNHWAKEECERQTLEYTSSNIKKVLGKVLYKVRFPLINISDVEVRKSFLEILTTKEMNDISKSTKQPARQSYYFPTNTRMNIFDSMGLTTLFNGQYGCCSLSSKQIVSLTLRSLILFSNDKHLQVFLESDATVQFGSERVFNLFIIELKDNELGRYINLMLPDNGYSFTTETTVHVSVIKNKGQIPKAPYLSVNHILDRACDYNELVVTYSVSKERWRDLKLPVIKDCRPLSLFRYDYNDAIQGFAFSGSLLTFDCNSGKYVKCHDK